MQVWNVLHAARWKIQDARSRQKSTSGRHRTILSGYIFAAKAHIDNRKTFLSSNISSTYPRNMVNFGPLSAEIGPVVWGIPANFTGFRMLVPLLQRRRSTEANQTLHDVWQSSGLVHFRGACSLTEFCQVQYSLCVQVLHSLILAALLHNTRVLGASQTLRRWTEGATYILQGGHHVGHWPTF